MTFKQEMVTALQFGKDDRALVDIAHRHYGEDEKEKGAYQALEQIWHDLGFHESEETSPMREQLEYVMERVWYFGVTAC